MKKVLFLIVAILVFTPLCQADIDLKLREWLKKAYPTVKDYELDDLAEKDGVECVLREGPILNRGHALISVTSLKAGVRLRAHLGQADADQIIAAQKENTDKSVVILVKVQPVSFKWRVPDKDCLNCFEKDKYVYETYWEYKGEFRVEIAK